MPNGLFEKVSGNFSIVQKLYSRGKNFLISRFEWLIRLRSGGLFLLFKSENGEQSGSHSYAKECIGECRNRK
nr:7371_t:CDS:2 [Entrophospora candida]